MNSGDAGNLDNVELCPNFRATVLLSCQRYRKGKELCVCKHSTHSSPAPGMCLLPLLGCLDVCNVFNLTAFPLKWGSAAHCSFADREQRWMGADVCA